MRKFCFSFFILFILFFANHSVQACSCISSGLPCQSFWTAEAVFSGEVTDVREVKVGDENKTENGFRSLYFIRKKVSVTVEETFRGAAQQTVEIATGRGGGDCGFSFEKGQKYLIYAYKNLETGELSTGICTRTRLLDKASEDIEYFRSLASAKSGSTIFGKIYQTFVRKNDEPYKQPKSLADVAVIAENENGKFETRTDSKGEYRFVDLTPGKYNLSLLAPKNLWGYEKERKVEVFDKGCVNASFSLQTKTFLSGKLLDENSEPVAETSVQLIPFDQLNKPSASDIQFGFTDKSGDFLFRSIPSGKYYLGIRLSGTSDLKFPYPQTFYPGTTDLKKAEIITINEGDVLENFDFKLPKRISMRRIEGKVFLADGMPAAGASLSVKETEYFQNSISYGLEDTQSDGKFSFELNDKIKYELKVYITINGKQFHAEPIEIPADGDVTNLKIVISEPNGSCEKCLNPKKPKP